MSLSFLWDYFNILLDFCWAATEFLPLVKKKKKRRKKDKSVYLVYSNIIINVTDVSNLAQPLIFMTLSWYVIFLNKGKMHLYKMCILSPFSKQTNKQTTKPLKHLNLKWTGSQFLKWPQGFIFFLTNWQKQKQYNLWIR